MLLGRAYCGNRVVRRLAPPLQRSWRHCKACFSTSLNVESGRAWAGGAATELPIGIVPVETSKGDNESAAVHAVMQKVGVVGYGDPWVGRPKEDIEGLKTAITHDGCSSTELCVDEGMCVNAITRGGCSLIELGAGEGMYVNVDKGSHAYSWEMGVVADLVVQERVKSWEMGVVVDLVVQERVKREDLVLMSSVASDGLPLEDALAATRVEAQLASLLALHGLERLDVLCVEVPQQYKAEGGKASEGEHAQPVTPFADMAAMIAQQLSAFRDRCYSELRKASLRERAAELMGTALMRELYQTGRVGAVGFWWRAANPHTRFSAPPAEGHDSYEARMRDCVLGDIIACRDASMPAGTPLIVQYPVGVGSEYSWAYRGRRVLHADRAKTGRPFTFIDSAVSASQAPRLEALSELRETFNQAMHLERIFKDTMVSWAHILAHTQHRLEGYDEWVKVRVLKLEPGLEQAVEALLQNKQTREWATAYRHYMRLLLSQFTAMLEFNKAHLLGTMAQAMDAAAPSLSVLPPSAISARCVSAALSMGVDAVLSDVYVSQGDAATAPLVRVPPDEVVMLMQTTALPPSQATPDPEPPAAATSSEQQ
ncbi:hypothetical protein JKP88DRAFT_353885 [Tribonema minus]|uniref:Uncharacterized protein n=1 Tax=Tribonema minus TaxID=303371 RepID=A0A835Z4P2_9STRA|nr:hypothetical protein JKP88DRAFT_353885 [Tribonema minus]